MKKYFCDHEDHVSTCRSCFLWARENGAAKPWERNQSHTTQIQLIGDGERSRRLAICDTCPHYEKSTVRPMGRCTKCGCAAQGLVCPIHKWTTRHLHYYIWPTIQHDAWRWNCQELIKRAALFNGKKVVAVALGHGAWSLPDVKKELAPLGDVKYIPVMNSMRTWESSPWLAQWHHFKDMGPHDYVFRAHAKGVSKPAHMESSKMWATMMYESCLDYWPLAERELRTHPVAGSFKRRGVIAPGANVFFAGSFYWCRAKEGYERHRANQMNWVSVESWVGHAFRDDECGELFQDGIDAYLYHDDQCLLAMERLAEWKRQNANLQWTP